MATIKDLEAFEKAMEECREYPLQCRWVGGISVSYIEQVGRYIAVFDCDLTIVFDEVGYSSNTLYFYRNGDGYPIAHITHKGLNEFNEIPVVSSLKDCKSCRWYRHTHYKGTGEAYDECECHWEILTDLDGCQDYEPIESTTSALERCREAGYVQCVDDNCTCLDCKHSRTAEYVGGGTKFVCDELNIQTYKCAWCKHFKLKKVSE